MQFRAAEISDIHPRADQGVTRSSSRCGEDGHGALLRRRHRPHLRPRPGSGGELIEFPRGIFGIVLNLEEDQTSAPHPGRAEEIKEGDEVRRTGRIAEVPVGEALLRARRERSRPAVDGKGPIRPSASRRIELKAPGIVVRQPVKEPLQTGIKRDRRDDSHRPRPSASSSSATADR